MVHVSGRRLAVGALLLFAVACSSPSTLPDGGTTGVTGATHAWFPIDAGTAHELGRPIAEGAMACDSCHPASADTFAQYTCVGCHGHEEALTARLHLVVAGYRYASDACFGCHPTAAKQAYDHYGITGNCVLCHDVGTQFAALPKAGFTHPPMGDADCGACHGTSTWTGGGGAPAGPSRDPNVDVTVTALVPTYAGTSITKVTPLLETLPMAMSHVSTEIDAEAFSTCDNCHADARSGVFYPGTLHSALANLTLMQPTACTSCHGPGAAPTGFVGPPATSPARSPSSPEMKHDGVLWSNDAPTTTSVVPAECGLCHVAPGVQLNASWATGKGGSGPALYHLSLADAGVAQPASCVDCHANSRPTTKLTSLNSALAANLEYDHAQGSALSDCAKCHAKSALAPFAEWKGGLFHLAGDKNPTTCLPCHTKERPTATTSWTSTTYTDSPFDYVTNANGITHGDGQDCAVCHAGPGTGAWGTSQNWVNGKFTHGAATVSGTTCIACHVTQRPAALVACPSCPSAADFDHSQNGTGECFGCHQATVTAGTYVNYFNPSTHTLPGGDWKNGQWYPGSYFASSPTEFFTIAEISLNRSGGGFVTGTSTTTDTLYNGMLHISTVVPAALNAGPTGAPDSTKCWHCHTSTGTTVTSYKNGVYHSALTNYRPTPGAAIAAFAQPTTQCGDCHLQALPKNIVEQDGGTLVPMDHAAQFTQTVTIGDGGVSQVSQIDCSVCHKTSGLWADGKFHAPTAVGVPKDCVGCHYVLMADAPKSDVSSSTTYTMKHGASLITFQTCETCHTTALSKAANTPVAATLWKTGAYHPSLTAQPGACVDCHGASAPTASTQSSWSYTLAKGNTATNQGQWMSHGSSYVVAKDCIVCHAPDAKKVGSAWSKADLFHPAAASPTVCQGCHGLTNGGGAVVGTGNNLPTGLTDSATVTSASAASGVAGQVDQLTHADINVAGECSRCHTQAGISSVAGVQGKEWAQAQFHVNFNAASPLVMNGTTGRCSNCHMNLKPTAAYTLQDHGTFTAASGSQDCTSCHSWPGTGTAAAPNWLGATGQPQNMSVGGFSVSRPPATVATTQDGIGSLPHPPTTSGICTVCHASSAGGKQAKGYDHASALINSKCAACHEAGSNLVGTVWNNATVMASGAGDTRPYTLTSVVASYGKGLTVTYANHFYPVDCSECHVVPGGNGLVTTGDAYLTAWAFPHTTLKMTNPSTCLTCHTGGIPGAPDGGVNDPNTTITVDAGIPRYSGTSIVSVSGQSETLLMSMNHASTEIPTAAYSSCANCHDTATSGVYYPGTLHAALTTLSLAEPTACASCHANAVPAGFVGPRATSPARTPASAEMKHDAVRWSNGAATTTKLVSTNCGMCHLSPTDLGETWAVGKAGTSPATYHPALSAASVAQPTSCLDCHANNRPTVLLTSGNSGLAANLQYDHSSAAGLGDCASCHAKSMLSPWASWSGGLFHLVGSSNPTTCLPCHTNERPTSTTGWVSTTYQSSPFDYGTNPSGITHGDGLDCVTCHAGPGSGAWGTTQNWVNGSFTHGAATASGSTCIACHETQRPTSSIACPGCKLSTTFVHSTNGTGDCIGCHQATVTANTYVNYYNPSTHTLPGGDWQGGQDYPGSVFTSSSTQFITVNEIILNRSGAANLVTSTSSIAVTLYNGMLHTSAALPTELNAGPTSTPDFTKCWHCHTSTGTNVTSYVDGKYHTALTAYRATPTGTVVPFPQPTAHCSDCHAEMFPSGIVQKAASDLVPMDHSAQFTGTVVIGGASVTSVSQVDCSVCHHGSGTAWTDGLFHTNIGSAVPQDCVTCHYPLMADAPKSDLTSAALYTMKHRSGQLTFQACQTCHAAALGKSATTPAVATLWQTGAYHGALTTQPTTCLDCHTVSEPAANASTQSSWSYTLTLGGTSTNAAQWMNHGASSVVGQDCVLCHAADAKKSGSAWLKADLLHTPVPSTTACQICHGLTNGGGSVAGTKNNLPSGLTNSTWITTASSSPANTHDQIIHTDINVSAKDCNFCHTQAGLSSTAGVTGKEWAQASFHKYFTAANPLVMNGGTGRCSNCHMNVKPGTTYAAMDHSAYTASSTMDCVGCHAWPGTGTTAAPNWLGAVGAHAATGSTSASTLDCNTCHGQTGSATKHLTVAAASHYGGITNGNRCVTCHINFTGFKDTITNLLYPHSNATANSGGCVTCHAFKSQIYTTLTNTPALTYPVATGGHTFSQTTNVTVSYSGESHTQAHTASTMTACGSCHVYAKTTAALNIWTFKHNAKNTGISNSKSSGGCALCHG